MKKFLIATTLSLFVATAALAQNTNPSVIIPDDDGTGTGGSGTGGTGGTTSQPNLTYHGGSVVQNAKMT